MATALLALVLSAAAFAAGRQPTTGGGRTVEARVVEHDEFRWGDAGIGALAGAGLVTVCVGVFVATGRRRRSTS